MAGPESYPYYIMTPDYKTSSLGIQVMHYLCHLLNERGYQAWIVNAKTNPEWNTPQLNDAILNSHRNNNIPAISVYPEIISGNPLNTPVVARYMLNREGVMNGNNINAGKDDLFFWYRSEFAEKMVDPLLRLELYDLDLFSDDNSIKDTHLLYLNRIQESYVDFSQFPENIEILSMKNPLSLEQLAAKLKRAKVLYTFESSGTNALAILCGCPVVALTMKGLEKYAITPSTLKDTGAAGYAWDDNPETLAQVRETMGDLRKQMMARREQGQLQLVEFINKTQSEASRCWMERQNAVLAQWLIRRQLPQRHSNLAKSHQAARLMIIVHLNGVDTQDLITTVQSIISQQFDVAVMAVVSNEVYSAELTGVQIVNADDFSKIFSEIIGEGKYDWVQNVDAGNTFSSGSLAVLLHFLSATNCVAVAGDELWLGENNQAWHLNRKSYDWELYIRAPHVYMKRWVISCNSIKSLLKKDRCDTLFFDFDILLKLRESSTDEMFTYIDDILVLVDNTSNRVQPLEPYREEVEKHLINVGYPQVHVNIAKNNLLKIRYHHSKQPLVTVIIFANDNLAKLQNIITGFFEKNTWANFELLIVNNSNNSSETNKWLDELAKVDVEKIRVFNEVLSSPMKLMYSSAVENARGEYFLFLDEDLIFVTNDWLPNMMEQALCHDVGCVGPKLINKDQKVLSAGIGFDCNGYAQHIGQHVIWHSMLGQGQLLSIYQPAFIDNHCWMVSRDCWEKVNFSDDELLDPLHAVADFMFRAQESGFRVIAATDSIIVFNRELRTFNSEDQAALQFMRSKHLASTPSYESGSFSLNDFSSLTINDDKRDSCWIAKKQLDMPLFIILGKTSVDGYSRYFIDLLKNLEEKEFVRLIHVEMIPCQHELIKWNPNYLVFLSEELMPGEKILSTIKKECNTLIYRLSGGVLVNKSLAPWLHLPVLDGWLAYTIEQAEWLKKRKQKVIEINHLFDLEAINNEKNNSCLTLRALCDTRFMNKKESDFLTEVIRETSQFVEWIVYGDCPVEWRNSVREIYRLRQDHLGIVNIDFLLADIVLFPIFTDGGNQLRDGYGQLFYLSKNKKIISNSERYLMNDCNGWLISTKSEDWVKLILDIAENKRVGVDGKLYSPVEFSGINTMNEKTVADFLSKFIEAPNSANK